MATATKKAGTAAKSNNKSNSKTNIKKAPARKAESVKSAAAKMPATTCRKSKRTEADGFTEKQTTLKTGKTVSQDAKKGTKKSVKPTNAKASNGEGKKAAKTYSGLSAETLVEMYRTMYQSRRIDDKEIQLKGQNKIFFNFGRGTRSCFGCRRASDETGLRLVFPLLPRPRFDARSRNDDAGNALVIGRSGKRPELARTADAFALGTQRFECAVAVFLHGNAGASRGRRGGSVVSGFARKGASR